MGDASGDETLWLSCARGRGAMPAAGSGAAGATMGIRPRETKPKKPEKPAGNDHIIGVLAHEAHLDGSKLFPCTVCRRQVWMSPASQRLLATGKWVSCCMGCGEAAIASGAEFGGAAPGAVEEFNAWLQRN